MFLLKTYCYNYNKLLSQKLINKILFFSNYANY